MVKSPIRVKTPSCGICSDRPYLETDMKVARPYSRVGIFASQNLSSPIRQIMNFLKVFSKSPSLIDEANSYVAVAKEGKKLPTIESSALMEKNELAFMEGGSILSEPRSVRKTSGGMAGVRIMKGVTVGGFGSESRSSLEWTKLDSGILTITNQRLLFRGNLENRTIPLNKIVSFNTTKQTIEVSVDGKTKISSYKIQNPYIWGTIFNILRNVADPSDLSGVDLDITFK